MLEWTKHLGMVQKYPWIDVNLWNIEIIYINSFYYNFWIVLIQ